MVLAPDGQQLIISEMGEFMLDTPGQLVLFDLAEKGLAPMDVRFEEPESRWLDARCEIPEAALFSPHGIDLTLADDGSARLWVVNHGGRESVEVFSLVQEDGDWSAIWQGCAQPPGDPFINDVSGLKDGGFLVTHMWDKHQAFEDIVAALTAGENTGWVWRWRPDEGFSQLPGSAEMMPNGIAVSPDNQFAFVNIYMGNRTIKLDLETGEKVGQFDVRQPDNITLDDEGNLWVASHQHDPINETCAVVETGACLLPFQILRVNAQTLEKEVFLAHEGEPMGYTTVAFRAGDRIYMGSAHGDRIASVEMSSAGEP